MNPGIIVSILLSNRRNKYTIPVEQGPFFALTITVLFISLISFGIYGEQEIANNRTFRNQSRSIHFDSNSCENNCTGYIYESGSRVTYKVQPFEYNHMNDCMYNPESNFCESRSYRFNGSFIRSFKERFY